jgi:hypothetical protein
MHSHNFRRIAVGLHLSLIALGIIMLVLEFMAVEAPVHELSFLL